MGSLAEQLRQIFVRQIRPAIATLCEDTASASTRAGLVASQMLGFALCRYIIKLPPIVAMKRSEVVAWVGPTVQRYIRGERTA